MKQFNYNDYIAKHEDTNKFGFVQLKPSRTKMFVWVFLIMVLVGIGVLGLIYSTKFPAPKDFPQDTILNIEEGTTLKEVARILEEGHIIRSKTIFQTFAIILGGDRSIVAGYYGFKEAIPVYEVARRVARGDRQIPQFKITIPEGYTRAQMAEAFSLKFPEFNKTLFLEKTKDKEGFLFPETYFFFPFSTEDSVIKKMSDTFTKRMEKFKTELSASLYSEKDIITMASIIEKEAKGDHDRAIISGILWKRMQRGIPLQVDATFMYINGKQSSELTLKDLAIDSKYNTYKYKGLPPGPIASPGEESIRATLYPEESPYLFYLHSDDGQVYFARTYEEHLQNKKKYLD